VKESEKHQTLSLHIDVRRSISTKLSITIEPVRAIIALRLLFLIPSVVQPLGAIDNFVENVHIEVNYSRQR